MSSSLVWDIYCKVIDNYGDIGVCWRLCADLGSRGNRVRLFVDDASALQWMAPRGAENVDVFPFDPADGYACGDVVIEAFGCDLPDVTLKSIGVCKPVWINLEYLTAESFAERNHGLSSPVMQGPAAGASKFFFYPGFTEKTGGLIREEHLFEQQKRAVETIDRSEWLQRHSEEPVSGVAPTDRWVSLFCYEPASLEKMLGEIGLFPGKTRVLVTHGRATAVVRERIREIPDTVELHFLKAMPQNEYDELLWLSDLNFVRGEDSVVRAIWSDKPFIWQIYPQDDAAHHAKLDAFLSMANAPLSWREAHYGWNSIGSDGSLGVSMKTLGEWRSATEALRSSLSSIGDLTTQLANFVQKKR